MQTNIFKNLSHSQLIYLFCAINNYHPVIDLSENKKIRDEIKDALESSLEQYKKLNK